VIRRTGTLILAVFMVFFLSTASFANPHKKAEEKGPAILLVTFGTSIPEAQAAFVNIEKKVKEAFPDVPVRWAYTSSIIRHKLAKQGQTLDSVETALARLMDEGYTSVAVQSLHMIPGYEFNDIMTNVRLFGQMSGGFSKVVTGMPLLSSDEDMEKAVASLVKILPKERKKDEAVILMGHGTGHSSDAIYSAMMYKFEQVDPNIYVGTVEGHPTFDAVKAALLKKGIKKAYLIPLMSVAGDHARNDMSGNEADSWKSMLTEAGIESVPLLKGMGEYDGFVDIWMDHLKAVMKHFK